MKTLKDIEHDIFEVNARLKHIQEDVARLQEKPELEFKVGQWAKDNDTGRLFYIKRIENGKLYGEFDDPIKGDQYCWYYDCSIPTSSEIESHLRKICDEKYVGKKVRSVVNEKCINIIRDFCYYNKQIDEVVYYNNTGDFQMTVYQRGKFAQIIPDKKKLPKTKEEFEEFIVDWLNYKTDDYNIFLNEYDFES